MTEKKAEKTQSARSRWEFDRRSKWLEHWRAGVTARHANNVSNRMDAGILPSLGPRPIAMIDATEVVAMAKAIEDRGASHLAKADTRNNRFRYAIANRYAKVYSAIAIHSSDIPKSTKVVNFARINEKDLSDLLKAIEIYRGTQLTRLAFKLMTLTFVSTQELIAARWDTSIFRHDAGIFLLNV